MTASITLQLPDPLYQRLINTAHATQRPIEAVILQALEVGSPPSWDDVPEGFRADLEALDRCDDSALWTIVRDRKAADEMARYDELLERNQLGTLTESERSELVTLRMEADRFMLRRAHAAALLRWRGHLVPQS